jgi:hypothetical protein
VLEQLLSGLVSLQDDNPELLRHGPAIYPLLVVRPHRRAR